MDNYDDDDDDFLTLDTGNDKKDKNVFMASGLDFTADAYEELGIKNKEVTVCIEDSKGRVNKLVVRLSDNTEDAVRNFFRKHGPTKRFIDAQKEKLVHNDSTDRDLTLSFEIQGTGKRLATRPATLEKDILAFFKSNDMPDDVISSTVELVEAEKEKAIKSH